MRGVVGRGGWASLAGALTVAACLAGDPVPDFRLLDANSNSPRSGAQVSPRDYMLRVSAFYFAGAGCSYCREQFHHLTTVWQELQATNPPVSIEILGVNFQAESDFNFLIPLVSTLPWLQDTAETDVWSQWAVEWDDVFVLDTRNRLVSVFNLLEHNLALASERAALKEVLLEAARPVDTDRDDLPDDWEWVHWGNLAHGASEDTDGDGFPNGVEYAFGTLPQDPESRPAVTCVKGVREEQPVLVMTFRRRAGAALDYLVTMSPDPRTWANDPTLLVSEPLRQLYDGSGTAEATYWLLCSPAPNGRGFVRVQALPHSGP